MFEREDKAERRFQANIHGFDLVEQAHGPAKPGAAPRRTGLRSFHDRIARKLKAGRR